LLLKLVRTSLATGYAWPRGGDLAAERRGARPIERDAARAHARLRGLLGARALLRRRAGAVPAGGRGGHGARVLEALGAGGRPLAWAGVGDVVRRRAAQPRLELRAPLGARRSRRGGRGRLAERGRAAAGADLPRALRGGDEAL